jgi:hypothetical protein
MLKQKKLLTAMMIFVVATLIVVGCSESDKSIDPKDNSIGVTDTVRYDENIDEAARTCTELPPELPEGVLLSDVNSRLHAKEQIPFEMLAPEVLKTLAENVEPGAYYIDSLGLHWGHPKKTAQQLAAGNCYHAYGFSIVGSLHFVYWFHYRPPSYDAYMAWIKIYAQPYGSNGILVQKRDICWICGCNPFCALLWTWVCAK